MGPKANKNTNKRYLEIIWYLKYCCRNCGFIFCVSNYCEIRIAMSYTMKIGTFDVECQVERFYLECRWCKVVRDCSVPGLLLVLAPGDPVQPGVGEGPQGGEGRVVVAPLQRGARAVANLNMHHQYYRSSQCNGILIHILGTLCDHDHIPYLYLCSICSRAL